MSNSPTAQSSRRRRFNKNAPTSRTIRTNLRNLRKAKGLRLVDLEDVLEDSSILTASTLARIESGERDISAVELTQLAVALGVTPNDLVLPWPNSSGSAQTLAISGAGRWPYPLDDVENWWKRGIFPPVTRAPRRGQDAIEGQALTDLLRSNTALASLAADPSPAHYHALLKQFISARFEPIRAELDDFLRDLFIWLPETKEEFSGVPGKRRAPSFTSPEWAALTDSEPWSEETRDRLVGILCRLMSGDAHLNEMNRLGLGYVRYDHGRDAWVTWLSETGDSLQYARAVLNTLLGAAGIDLTPMIPEGGYLHYQITWPDTFGADPVKIYPNLNMLYPPEQFSPFGELAP